MIRKVSFRNFKALRHVDVTLERLTVIVGPNASGKTSILEGIRLLERAAKSSRAKVFAGHGAPRLIRSAGADADVELAVTNETAGFRLRIAPPAPREAGGTPLWGYFFEKVQNGAWEAIRTRQEKIHRAPSAALLRFDANRLAAASYVPSRMPKVSESGLGLASALAQMKLTDEDNFRQLEEALRAIIPSVRRIRFDRERLTRMESETITIGNDKFPRHVEREYWADCLVFDVIGANDVPALLMSEGTLLVLGLLAVILGPLPPDIILLDDIERGIHPQAQRDLVLLLRKLLDQRPRMQIVATTHSPYLIDEMKPEEVRLTSLKEDGSVVCAGLNEHPEFERWRTMMSPGEFWSHVGERWVAERQEVEVPS
jgi:predicted ATPase